ncbi:MAG: hypothetical protein ACR2G6_11875 [Gemmatimonadaceae bacterium]
MIVELLGLAATVAAAAIGYFQSRRFVRGRLRFVDAAQSPVAPWLAGAAASVLALPVTAILPVVGLGTALILGAGVGTGVAHGKRDVRRLNA